MKSTQAWGWLIAGVLALGLNGFYQDGGAAWAHRAVDRVIGQTANHTEAAMALALGRVDWFQTKTQSQVEMVAAQGETASCRLATSMARLQTKLTRQVTRQDNGLARFEAMTARQEAAMARVEVNRARMEAQLARIRVTPAAFESVSCPRVRVVISR
jgi:hypothetical protein